MFAFVSLYWTPEASTTAKKSPSALDTEVLSSFKLRPKVTLRDPPAIVVVIPVPPTNVIVWFWVIVAPPEFAEIKKDDIPATWLEKSATVSCFTWFSVILEILKAAPVPPGIVKLYDVVYPEPGVDTPNEVGFKVPLLVIVNEILIPVPPLPVITEGVISV